MRRKNDTWQADLGMSSSADNMRILYWESSSYSRKYENINCDNTNRLCEKQYLKRKSFAFFLNKFVKGMSLFK